MTRIYTRTGDDGTTGLIGGKRVPKNALRIDAYGTVDELNAVIGMVRSFTVPEPVDRLLGRIQDDLFTVGADLASPDKPDSGARQVPSIGSPHVENIEAAIDSFEEQVEPLRQFILPGGSQVSAALHFARTVARRAERCCVALSHNEPVNPLVLSYLNRLSDLCFVLARAVNRGARQTESHPTFNVKL